MQKLVLCIVFIIWCNLLAYTAAFGSDLSRSQAAKILKDLDYGEVTRNLNLNSGAAYWDGVFQCPGSTHQDGTQEMLNSMRPIENMYNSLQAGGFITFTREVSDPSKRPQEQYACDSKTYIIITAQPTPKLNDYITYSDGKILKLKLVDYVFEKITGIIKESNTSCIVEFTVKAKTNILANYFGLNKNDLYTQSKSVHFKLYDDGWRLYGANIPTRVAKRYVPPPVKQVQASKPIKPIADKKLKSDRERLVSTCKKGTNACILLENKFSGLSKFQTIQEAVNSSSSGDTILLVNGIFDEKVNIVEKSNLTITGVNASIELKKDENVISITKSNNIKIQNISVRHNIGETCTNNCIVISDSNRISINKCDIHGSGYYGIIIDGYSANTRIEDNKIHNCSIGIGVYVPKGSKIIFTKNQLYENGNDFDIASYDDNQEKNPFVEN